jgi:hypothetical protein
MLWWSFRQEKEGGLATAIVTDRRRGATMRVTRMLGLAAFVVIAASAMIGVASASATLTYKECFKTNPKDTGDYTSKECTAASKVSGTGKYESVSADDLGVGKTKKVELYTAGVGEPVVCQKGRVNWLIPARQEGAPKETVVSFEHCTERGEACTGDEDDPSSGVINGGWGASLREPDPGVVEEVQTQEVSGPPVIEDFSCAGLHIEIRGGSGGVITGDIDAATKKETVTFSGAGGLEAETNDDPGLWLPLYETFTVLNKYEVPTGIFN